MNNQQISPLNKDVMTQPVRPQLLNISRNINVSPEDRKRRMMRGHIIQNILKNKAKDRDNMRKVL